MRSTDRLLVLFLVVHALALPAEAGAQETEPGDSIQPVPLAPLTVTALRMPLTGSRVPYAVTAVNVRREGRAQPGMALDEALRAVPGVQVDNRYNYALGERVSIRGFGARAQFGVRGVKVLLDGIPATVADGQTTLNHIDLGSLGRAEVIRGPAASLHGNAAGGVIQLETVRPPAAPLAQELEVLGGENGLLRFQSRTGGRSGRLGYQLNLARLTYDGYRGFSAADHYQGDFQLRYEAGADRLQLSGNFVDYFGENPGSLSDSLLRVDRFQPYANNVRQQTREEGRQGQLGLLWRHRTGSGELEVGGYGVLRSIDNPIPPAVIDLDRQGGGARVLYRGTLALGGEDVLWTVGSDLDVQHDDRRNFENQEGTRGALTLDQLETVRSVGVFGQVSVPVAPGLSALLSLRYDHFRFSAEDRLIGAVDPNDSGDRSLDAVSPTLGVTWNPTPALDLYANYTTSFQTPTTTELANRPSGAGGFNPDLEPEHTRSYELGARGRVGALVHYQLAVYRAVVDDELIGFEVPGAPGRTYFRNAGSALHRGVEMALGLAPAADLTGRLSYTFTHAEFQDYQVGDDVYDGNRLPGVAPHRVEAVLTYEPGPWYVELDGRYLSSMEVNDANTASAPAHTVFAARAGRTATTVLGLDMAPFVGVRNLLDEAYITSVVINAFGGRYFEPGPGRAFYAGLRVGAALE